MLSDPFKIYVIISGLKAVTAQEMLIKLSLMKNGASGLVSKCCLCLLRLKKVYTED